MEPAVDDIFRTVPQDALPEANPVAFIETPAGPRVLIREDTPLPAVIAALNPIALHLVRHGLWRPQPEDTTPPRLRHAG
jgi:hypothetical protein